ncbi:MAG: hypothetical protein M3O15_15110 [Acidobacteriota bacterium]|nr:hypothetical protein [Acidobacteriota bacterium]
MNFGPAPTYLYNRYPGPPTAAGTARVAADGRASTAATLPHTSSDEPIVKTGNP